MNFFSRTSYIISILGERGFSGSHHAALVLRLHLKSDFIAFLSKMSSDKDSMDGDMGVTWG